MPTISFDVSEDDARHIALLVAACNKRNEEDDGANTHGQLDTAGLFAMLAEDCALMMRRPGCWEAVRMNELLSSHGYSVSAFDFYNGPASAELPDGVQFVAAAPGGISYFIFGPWQIRLEPEGRFVCGKGEGAARIEVSNTASGTIENRIGWALRYIAQHEADQAKEGNTP